MNIRVIAGRYGGRIIEAPATDNTQTKPMGERIRNAMFNILGATIDDTDILDAFAGTGSVGLEALSRGAAHVTFVERDRIAQKILLKNVASLGAENEATVVCSSLDSWIASQNGKDYDIIFADPPYQDTQLSTVSKLFALLKPNGLMVLSHPGRGEGPNLENGIVVVDNRSYGNAHLTFFRRVS